MPYCALCFRGAGDAEPATSSCRSASGACGPSPATEVSVPSLPSTRRRRRHEQEEEAVPGHARAARLRAGAGPRVSRGAGCAGLAGTRRWGKAQGFRTETVRICGHRVEDARQIGPVFVGRTVPRGQDRPQDELCGVRLCGGAADSRRVQRHGPFPAIGESLCGGSLCLHGLVLPAHTRLPRSPGGIRES